MNACVLQLIPGFDSSVNVSTAAPVTVQVAFVRPCEPAHMRHEDTLSDAAYATLEVTPSVSASSTSSRRVITLPPLRTGSRERLPRTRCRPGSRTSLCRRPQEQL